MYSMSITESLKKQTEFAEKHIDVKLLKRIKLFIVIYILLLGYIIYDVAVHDFDPLLIVGGFLLGIAIGYIAGRMFNIKWHTETSKVVAQLDTVGIVILILYIAFSISRSFILGIWLHGPLLTAVSLTFATGAILGRIMMMYSNIKNVLSERGLVLPHDNEITQ